MAPLARRTLWRLREAALGLAAFTETFAGGRAGSRGECFGTCALLYKVLVRYCTRCLYATVHDACTLLYKVIVRYCTRCLYATVQGDCTLLYKALVRYCTRCLHATVQGACAVTHHALRRMGVRTYSPSQSQNVSPVAAGIFFDPRRRVIRKITPNHPIDHS